MSKVIVNNVPATNRNEFGYRNVNESHDHNVNQQNISDDILDLFNKANNIEKKVLDNETYIKQETSYIEAEKATWLSIYKQLLQSVNEIVNDEVSRKKIVLPKDCKEDNTYLSAVINRMTNCITPRYVTKVSKLSILDTITDKIYLPDTLGVFIQNLTYSIISETDNDIYAPFDRSDDLYWVRDVVTDNTTDYVDTDYIINMPEEIMTSPLMNEIAIYPYMCKVINIQYRYGDSMSWNDIEGFEYNKIANQQDFVITGPVQFNFAPVKANQVKITIRSHNYKESETDLRNFSFGLKHVGIFLCDYSDDEMSYLSTEVKFDEEDCSIVISNIIAEFNNSDVNSHYQKDIQYEFFFKNNKGVYQYIADSLPFIIPSNEILIKLKIAEKYKNMNISHFCLNYNVINDNYKILISFIDDILCDYRSDFSIYYSIKSSSTPNIKRVVGNMDNSDIVKHELSVDDGVTWEVIDPEFNGVRYKHTKAAFLQDTEYEKCYIRVTDFNGAIGISNRFKISAVLLDHAPKIDSPPSKIYTYVGKVVNIIYRAYDETGIVEHQFSEDGGYTWGSVNPTETQPQKEFNYFSKFVINRVYNTVGNVLCQLRITDGLNGFIYSELFEIIVQPIPVTDFNITDSSVTINVGDMYKIPYVILPTDASDQLVHWSTSNSKAALVDNVGIVTGVNPGLSTITGTTNDQGIVDSCDVIVKMPVTQVEIIPSQLQMYVGETYSFSYVVHPFNATNKTVMWTAGNNCVSVDSSGNATALQKGASSVSVISLDSNVFAICLIDVLVPVSGITLNKYTETINATDTDQLIAIVMPIDAHDRSVIWTSSDPSIATVDQNGVVTGISSGTAIITATTNHLGMTASCEYTVTSKVTGVQLDHHILDMYVNNTFQLTAIITPQNADNKSLQWSSSDTNIATVDANGIVSAHNLGQAIITVTSVDSGISDTCTVFIRTRITDIKLNPTLVKVINVNNPSWHKNVTAFLEGFDTPETTEREVVEIESRDNTIASPFKATAADWVTNIYPHIVFSVYGKQTGSTIIDVKTQDNRIQKQVQVLSGDPIESYEFINVPVDPDGMQRIQIPGGFTRNLKYTVTPDPCIFTLGDAEGKVVTTSTSTGRVEFDSDYNAFITHINGGGVSEKQWTSLYELKGFYNPLPNFEVTWTKDLYEIQSTVDPIVTCRADQEITIQIKANIDESILQGGDPSEYIFSDTIKVRNSDREAVSLDIKTTTVIDNRTMEVVLVPTNTTAATNTNNITIYGMCSINQIKFIFTLVN